MDFDSLMQEARSESACSQLFVHFPVCHPVWPIVQSIEEAGGRIVDFALFASDRPGYRIGLFKLTNRNVQNMVIALSEDGVLGVQGIGRRILS